MELPYGEELRERQAAQRREEQMEKICGYLLLAGVAALLSGAQLLFDVRPFGIALCAAAGKGTPAALVGTLLFCLWRGDYISLLACAVVAFCRLGASFFTDEAGERAPLFGERAGFRVLSAALSSLLSLSVNLFRGEFKTYYLIALLLGVGVSALAAWVICGLFLPRDALYPYSREAGLGALILFCIFAMRDVSFVGIYPAATCGALVGLWLAAHYGLGICALGALFCGLCFDVAFAPALLFCAAGFSLLQKSSRGGGILAGCGAASFYAFFNSVFSNSHTRHIKTDRVTHFSADVYILTYIFK